MDNEIRENGFIDLEKVFANPKCRIIPWRINESNIEEYGHSKVKYIFEFNNEIWIYKSNGKYQAYAELVAEELAKLFSLPIAHYDLAKQGNEKGVITKNFKLNGIEYIKGNEIIENYLKNLLGISDKIELEQEVKKYNCLEGIWNSLDYYYRYNKDREKIVFKLMDQLANVFIFDLLTGQTDRHSYNWGILEDNDTVSLEPLYDNERILYFESDFNFFVHTETDRSSYKIDYYKGIKGILSEFLTFSDKKYLNIIEEKMHLIEDASIENIFNIIESRTHAPMPDEVKEDILYHFKILRKLIKDTILEYKKHQKRLKSKSKMKYIVNYFLNKINSKSMSDSNSRRR